jgi:hypothetical protein
MFNPADRAARGAADGCTPCGARDDVHESPGTVEFVNYTPKWFVLRTRRLNPWCCCERQL